MRSVVAVTNEIDDAQKAVQDLLKQVNNKGPLYKNSCGFVFCDVDINYDIFTLLEEKFPFEIVGCTSLATFDTERGTQIISVVLVILTANDAVFAVAVMEALTKENLRQELEAAYKRAAFALGGQGKLLLLFPPFNDAISPDSYVDILSAVSGDIPIFGGLPSSNAEDGNIVTSAKGQTYTDCGVIVLVGGNIHPLFAVQNVLSTFSEQKCTVTKAQDNIIYTVNNMTFTDYLQSIGLDVNNFLKQGDLAVYVSIPLKVYLNKNDNNDGIPVARTIKFLNPEDGSGILFGSISEKSEISIATMKRQDIQDSCKRIMKEILEKIGASQKENTDTYTTLICVSCGGRYIVMADDKNIEGDIILQNLPKNLTLSGFYAYGEICPTTVHDGKAVNRVHNESIAICVL